MEKNYCRILIADDEVIVRQGIRHLVDWEKAGFQIVGEAGNGKEALELVEQLQPHILLSDVVMPQMDGIELAKLVRIKYPSIQVVMLSGYSDFDYVKSAFRQGAVDYILKPTLNQDELLRTLRKSASRVPGVNLRSSGEVHLSKSICQYLLGGAEASHLQSVQAAMPLPYYALLGVYPKYYQNDQIISAFFKNDLAESLQQFHPHMVEIEGNVRMAILNFEPGQSVVLADELEQLISQLAQITPHLFFVLSECFQLLTQLREVYSERFSKLVQKRFYFKGHYLMRADQFPPEVVPEPFDNKKFSKLISTLCFEQALDLLQNYVGRAVGEWQMDEHRLRALVENSIYNFLISLEDLKLNNSNFTHLKLNSLNKLEACLYADDFLQALQDICNHFRDILQKHKFGMNEDVINLITGYIHRHYNEQLSLTKIAEKFNFSYYYLSSYFRSRCEEGFSEYINRVRIEKAIEMLNDPAIPISSISLAVGYSDHSYFSKVFKKLTGMTPTEYRKGHK